MPWYAVHHSLIMGVSNRSGVMRLGAADFDEDCAHGAIKASDFAGFKCRTPVFVNDVDYYERNGGSRAMARSKKTQASS